jgi:REP element-mobilizing transposase RayT
MRIGVRQTKATTMCTIPVTLTWSGVRAYRRKVLTDGIDERLKHLIREGCQQLCAEIEELEVMPDHVHLGVKR